MPPQPHLLRVVPQAIIDYHEGHHQESDDAQDDGHRAAGEQQPPRNRQQAGCTGVRSSVCVWPAMICKNKRGATAALSCAFSCTCRGCVQVVGLLQWLSCCCPCSVLLTCPAPEAVSRWPLPFCSNDSSTNRVSDYSVMKPEEQRSVTAHSRSRESLLLHRTLRVQCPVSKIKSHMPALPPVM